MYDAIIVFGAGISHEGILERNTQVRVEKAVELFFNHQAPSIVMSGGWSFNLEVPPLRTEASAMVDYAHERGVPKNTLFTEERSRDTLGNALYVKTLFAIPRQWHKLIVIVAEYHAWRTKKICDYVFGPEYTLKVIGVPLALLPEEQKERFLRERASWALLEEVFKVPVGDHTAIEATMMRIHPGYSKNPEITLAELQSRIATRVEELRRTENIGTRRSPTDQKKFSAPESQKSSTA